MKKILLSFILIFINISLFYSQGNNCGSATPYCGSVCFANNINTTAPLGPAYGCLGSEPNPAWFVLKTTAAGTMVFTINQNVSGCLSGSAIDVDFICWGPFASVSNACNVLTGSCIGDHNCSGQIEDCSYSTAGVETMTIVSPGAGNYYMVMITNYANATGFINITQNSGPPTDCSVTCPSVLGGNGYLVSPGGGNMPATVPCTNPDISLIASNNTPFGNPITPAIIISFNANANTSNNINWYENGTFILCSGPSCGTSIVPSTGNDIQYSTMSPTATNLITLCETNSAQPNTPYTIIDAASGLVINTGTWLDDGFCQNISFPPGTLSGVSSWTISPACPGCLTSTDWGFTTFHPSVAGPGAWNICYSFDPPGTCPTYNYCQTITVTNPYVAAWTAPAAICGNSGLLNLTSLLNVGTTAGGVWTGTGVSGTNFNPAISGPGTFSVTYTVGAGACSATVSHNIIVNAPATVGASVDQSICSGSTATMAGTFGGGATTATWSTTGSGSFSSATSPTAVYTPSAADIAAGTVTITYTTNDPAGPCPAVNDPMVLTISPAATVNAGTDQTICSGSTATLGGSMGGGTTTVAWTTSGTGTFSNSAILNPGYTPSAGDISAGTVTLTITTNNPAGPCNAVTDFMVLTINLPAGTNAGPPVASICAGSTYLTAGASFSGSATSSNWTTSGSGTFASAGTPVTTYTPSAADIASGTVTLTITSNDPAGPCPAVNDFITLTINPAATAAAGSNQTICSGSIVTLTGSIGGSATTSTWTTSGSGTFANASLVNTTYTPSAADIAAGTVTLTLTTNDPAGSCTAATSNLTVTISPAATTSANVDAAICAGSTYTLAGSIGGSASTLTWTSSGSGTFSSTSSATATYTPSASDISAGTITLTITTNDPAGTCSTATDNMVLAINPVATANAGPAATICAGSTYSVPGSIGGSATTVTWTTSGSGSFSSTTSVTPTYTPSAADISAGTVTLTMTTNDPAGPCTSAVSTVVITINPAATVNANVNATICANQTYTLSGSQGGATTSVAWTSSGSGTFSNATILNPVYTPSASDISAGSVTLTLTSNDPAGACGSASDPMVLTITPLQNAAFTFGSATYCQTGTNPTPTITGVAGGTFTSAPAGLSINGATGTINLAASALNTYTITYTTPGPCQNSSNVSVTITLAPIATFSYAGPYCTSGADPFPTFGGGATAGTFSALPAGLTFVNVNTGQIDLSATTSGTYTVTNSIAASGGCAAANANTSVTINAEATANAGSAATICAGSTYTLAGAIGGSATTLTWTTSGSGTFSSATSATAVYTPSAADIAAGTVTLTLTTNDPAGPCPLVTSIMVITISPAATAAAGSAATICSGSTYTLAGVIGGSATSSTWSTSGTGTFNNVALLGAIYTPSAADIAAGTVTLTLTTNDPAGSCPAVTSNLVLTINPMPTVSAGSNATICSGSTYTLAGTMGGGATNITWTTSGSGTFSSATSLTATYTPSAADISAGTVTLTLTTNDPAGPCNAVTSNMTLTITPAATVSAGASATICAGSTYSLGGTFGGGATSITWSTSGTGTFNNTASTTAIYTPSAADISAGTVTLTITTNDPAGSCTAVTSTMTITINPAPTVAAGVNATICSGSTYTLSGSMGGGATSILWTTSGTGTFSSASSTTAIYTPSAADIAFGSITLTITTNDPAGPCTSISDFLTLTISPAPTVSAGAAASICNGSTYTLAGTMGGSATLVTWTTSGSGTFSNPNITTPTYTPSAADIAAGTVTLTITSNDPVGPCGSVNNSMVLTISPAATVSAGGSATICSSGTYTLLGSMGGSATSITWTTTGSGTFSSATSPTAVYTPSAADIAAGSVTLTITTNNPAGPCNAATDVMTLSINSAATVNAGPNAVICSNVPANLVGTFGGGATGVTWTTSGSGTFGSPTSATTTYTVSAADVIAGTVTLMLTTNDPAGVCGAVTDVMVLTINPQDNATFSYPSSTFCQTGTDPVATVAGGASGTFVATPAGLVFLNTSTGLIDVSASALGNYSITFTTSGICPNTSTIIVTVTSAPNATFNYATPFCQTGTALPSFGAGSSAGVFSASPVGLVFVSTSTGEIDLAASGAGTYTITNTIVAASGCAAASATTTVVIDPIPTVAAGADGTICEGSAYSLTGTMGGSASLITWSTSGTGTFSNVNSLTSSYTPSAADVASGSVVITITTNDPAGVCTQTTDVMTLTISVLDIATFNYSGSTFCQTATNPIPTITGLSGGIFSSVPATIVFVSAVTGEINLLASPLGTYDIIYLTNGICPNADTVSITITNAPSANFTYATPFCSSDVNPLPNFPVGSSGGIFTASPAGLVFVSTSTGEVDLITSIPGTYTITNTIAASGGCASATANTIIVIGQAATVDAGNSGTICAGDTYTITGASMGGSATSTTWTTVGTGVFDNTAILGATYTPSSIDTAAGTVTLFLITDDPAGGCGSVLDSLVITINSTPPAPAVSNPPPTCVGSPVSPISVVGATGSVTWYSDAGLTTIVSTANPYSPGTFTGSTSYWVTETFGTCEGPATQVDIIVNPLPVADTSLVVITAADCGTLTGSITGVTIVSGTAPYSYYWLDSLGNVVDTVLNLTGVGPGSYYLTITDSNGCSITIGGGTGFPVNSSSNVVASFTTDTTSGETPLSVTFTNTSTGATSYFWTFGTGDTSTVFSPTYTYVPLGQYTACLIASNLAGCADTACVTIDVFINSVFIIPNVFTPNNDNINDVFTVQAIGLETMDAEIYNRWGQKEYEWHTTNGGWDGRTASGVEAPDGTYFYIIKAKGFDDKEYFEKGYFTLIRSK